MNYDIYGAMTALDSIQGDILDILTVDHPAIEAVRTDLEMIEARLGHVMTVIDQIVDGA